MTSPTLLRELVDANIANYPSITGAIHPITLRSIGEFLGALAWLWALLISFTGWGRLAARILRVPSLPASVACAAGISVTIWIGGWLNLAGLVYRGVLFALIAAGLAFYLLERKQRPEKYNCNSFWKRSSTFSRIVLFAAFLILVWRVAGTVRLAHFDVSDDSAAYLALPQKMLETHHFAPDPFSERRITSGLGGSYFLQDLVLSANSPSNIGMADRTIGLLLLAGMALEVGLIFELSPFQIALLEFLIYLVPQETFNLTFIVLPVPLLLCIIWLVARMLGMQPEQRSRQFGYALLAGMVGAATISLKSTYLPVVGALSLVPCVLLLLRRKPRNAGRVIIAIVLGGLLVLIAWMIAMKITSDTWLFPILGRGFDYSRYGFFHAASRFPTTRSLAKVFLQGLALAALAFIQVITIPRSKFCSLSVSILIACAVAITALNYASSADSIWRYNFPQFLIGVIVFYAVASCALAEFPQSRSSRAGFCVGIVSLLFMTIYYDLSGSSFHPLGEFRAEFGDIRSQLAGLSGRRLVTPELQSEYTKAESAVPSGSQALENVAYSFLLNYGSRNIFIMDWPGAAAPPPGWPFGGDSARVAQYLKEQSIRYVLFDYRYALQSEAGVCHDLEGPYRFSQWLRQQLWMNALTVNQLNDLRSHYQSIYDDGSMAVIDLDARLANAPPGHPVAGIDASLDTVCSEVAARYFAANGPNVEKPQLASGKS